MRRKLVLIPLVIVACALLALAALPWWLGGALSLAGGRFGLEFDQYRRIGYTRFALEGVSFKTGAVSATVSRIELDSPFLWLAGRQGGVGIAEWSLTVAATEKAPAPEEEPSGWVPLRESLDDMLATVGRWLPEAVARRGEVGWPGGRIELGETHWTRGALRVDAVRWEEHEAALALAHDAERGRLSLSARALDGQWDAAVESEGAEVTAEGRWQSQPWTASAGFAPTGWLPARAQADAKAWKIPGSLLKLDEHYATVSGNASIRWENEALALDVQVEGVPVEGADAPPLRVALHGAGGLDRLRIERLELTVPGVSGRLSEPVEIGRDGRLLSGGSRFALSVDLAKQPWIANASGGISGSVNVIPGAEGVPLLEASLTSTDAAIADWAATRADVGVRVEWPRVQITAATIVLAGGDRLELGGSWDAASRTLSEGVLRTQVSHATAARWLPEGAGFDTLEVDVTAQGVWPEITHEGKVRAQALLIAPLRPLAVDAGWEGAGPAVSQARVEAVAGGTMVRLRGGGGIGSVRVDELSLSQGGVERLRLAKPARVTWAPVLDVEPLEFAGDGSALSGSVAWGETGRAAVSARNLRSSWFDDLWEANVPHWVVDTLEASAHWDRGPLAFMANAAAAVEVTEGRQARLALSAHGDGGGVALDALSVMMDGQAVLRGAGRVPVSVWPAGEPRLRLDEKAPLELNIETEPDAPFWARLSELAGVALERPEVDLKLSGTLGRPAGTGTIEIGRLSPGAAEWSRSLPEIRDISARLAGDRDGLALETFAARVAGQEVRASARLPVKEWAGLAGDPLAVISAAGEARIEIPDAEMSALARYAPAYLSPAGRLRLDVSLKEGGRLDGSVRLENAATRPLGPLGILQDVGAEIVLSGRTAEIRQVRAKTGGQPVTLTGKVSLSDGWEPRFDLALRGEKLPFVRQAGLLVRGDLDLRIVTDDAGLTRITGGTQLRDSLFLMDVRSLIPRGGARSAPGRRPPYFAVEHAPFDAWALDVQVRGDRFMRLRTPVFTGVLSTNFRLSGTLGDPRAIGEAVINEGQVLLPFATFAVRQGSVRLTESDPFDARLSLIGTGRRYGYDLRMELSGTAERPQLIFTSTPSLESDEVLLMVMAGELPQNELSFTGRQRAARLGVYLGQSLLDQFGADHETADRLSINVGERISRQGRETYGVEYEVAPRWTLVGEYDEFDEYNVGVKWRVWSEKKKTGEGDGDAAK